MHRGRVWSETIDTRFNLVSMVKHYGQGHLTGSCMQYLLWLSERDARESVATPPGLQLADELDAPFMTVKQNFWWVVFNINLSIAFAWTSGYCACVVSRRVPGITFRMSSHCWYDEWPLQTFILSTSVQHHHTTHTEKT